MTGNYFTTQEEPSDNYDIGSNNYDISNQDIHRISEDDVEHENARRSISSIADEIINLDIPAYNPGSDELGSGKQLYKCEECEASYNRKQGLLCHTRSIHESVVYFCQQCSYKAKQQSSLKSHQQAIHEGVKYACNQCEYQATEKGHLKTNQQSVLKRHQQAVHEGVKYSCNQCEYQATQQALLRLTKNLSMKV